MSTQTAQPGARAHTDGAWANTPVQTRNERFTSTNVADFPLVTGRESVWKFTPIDKIETLLNGEVDATPVEFEVVASSGVTVKTNPRDDSVMGRAGLPEERGSANAWSQVTHVQSITIAGANQHVELRRGDLGNHARAAHIVIESAAHSSGIVVIRNTGTANLSENIEIVVGEGSNLTVISVQQWEASGIHLGSHFAKVGRDASLKHVVVSLSGEVVRVNPSFHLAEQGSSVNALGAYFSSSGEHLEQQVYVDHEAAHTKSRVNYKGALHGDGARSVWIGDVLIRQTATGTDSYEQNRNLVLSDGTRADSIPNLEIETGDIAGAGHASATGRFDDEQLFYLMSRGVSEQEARKLVVKGFLLEVIQQIGDDSLEEELRSAIESQLDRSEGASS